MSQSPAELTIIPAPHYPQWREEQSPSLGEWLDNWHGNPPNPGTLMLISAPGTAPAQWLAVVDATDLYALHALNLQAGQKYHVTLKHMNEEDSRRLQLGWLLGSYRFRRYKKSIKPCAQLTFDDSFEDIHIAADASSLVCDLVNTPTEDMGPEQLLAQAQILAEKFDAHCTTTHGDQLLTDNFPAIHAVGRASHRAPRLIHLQWGSEGPVVAIVGKGVCFDTGGLNLKGAAGMRNMKKDMGGAAHALGLAHMIMAHELPVQLHVWVPAVENAVSGNALRPGDIINTRAGLTVEIGNTDAEGRLILSDALTRASEENPDLIIDFATLTGAARVALGPDLPPVYGRNPKTVNAIIAGGESTQDKVWPMPLHDGYRDTLESPIADLNNMANTPLAGSVTAALFLDRFVAPDIDWVHLDIFAWNPTDKPGRPQGAQAHGLRAVFEMLQSRYLA